MNSDRYSTDDVNTDHTEDEVITPRQTSSEKRQTRTKSHSAREAKTARKDLAPAEHGKAATKKTVSPPPKGESNARKTDGASPKKPSRKTPTNRVGKTALSKDAAMRAMAKQELVANNMAARTAIKAEQDSAKRSVKRAADERHQQTLNAAGSGILWTLLGIGLAACGGGTSYVSGGPSVAASDALREATNVKVRLIDGPLRDGTVYVADAQGNRQGQALGKTDEHGELDLAELEGLTDEQRANMLKNGVVVDLAGARDMATGEVYLAGELRSLPGQSFNLVTPITTIVRESLADPSVAGAGLQGQDTLDTLFGADSGITLEHIKNYLNYEAHPAGSNNPSLELQGAVASMSVRILKTLEKFIVEDKTAGTPAEKAARALQKLKAAIETIYNKNNPKNEDGTLAAKPSQQENADNVEGLLKATDVEPLITNAINYGRGKPTAAPETGLQLTENGKLAISLDSFGFGDSERNEEFGAITFTNLSSLRGTLHYVTKDENGEDEMTEVEVDTPIKISDVVNGEFIFTPKADFVGTVSLSYKVKAKAKGKAYDGKADAGALVESEEATLAISVIGDQGLSIDFAKEIIFERTKVENGDDIVIKGILWQVKADGTVKSYQWVSRIGPGDEWTDIEGQTLQQYLVTDKDFGREIGVRVTFSNNKVVTLSNGLLPGTRTTTEESSVANAAPINVVEVTAFENLLSNAQKTVSLPAPYNAGYTLIAAATTNDNRLVTVANGTITFNAGVFDFENAALREDTNGRKYFLIELTNAGNPPTTAKVRVYITDIDELAHNVELTDNLPDFDVPVAEQDRGKIVAKQSSVIIPLRDGRGGFAYNGEEIDVGVLKITGDDSPTSDLEVIFSGDHAALFTSRWNANTGAMHLIYIGGVEGLKDLPPGHAFDLKALGVKDRSPEASNQLASVKYFPVPLALPLVLNGVKLVDSDSGTPDVVVAKSAVSAEAAVKIRELDFAATPLAQIIRDTIDGDIVPKFSVYNKDGTKNLGFDVRFEGGKFYLYQKASIDKIPPSGTVDLVVIPTVKKLVAGASWQINPDAANSGAFIAINFANILSVDSTDSNKITIADGRLHNKDTAKPMLGEIAFNGLSFDLSAAAYTNDAGARFGLTVYVSQNANGTWSVKVIKTADIGNARNAESNPGLAARSDDPGSAIFHYVLGTIAANSKTLAPPTGSNKNDMMAQMSIPFEVKLSVVALDGDSEGKDELSGAVNIVDEITIDGTASAKADADTIVRFDHTEDKIKIGDGSAKTVHLRLTGTELVIYDTDAGAANALSGANTGILAVVTLSTALAADQMTTAYLQGRFSGTVTVESIVNVHDGVAAAANNLAGSTADAIDLFIVDANYGTRASADKITAFHITKDKIRIGDGTKDATLFVRTESDNKLVIYNNETNALAGADASILAVVTLTAAIADNALTIESIQSLFYGTGTFTVSSIIKSHSGIAETADTLTGVAALTDVFAIDAAGGTKASADKLNSFDLAKDKIRYGDGTGEHTIYVRAEGTELVIYNDADSALKGTDENILAVVTPTPALTDANLTMAKIQALFVSNGRGRVTVDSVMKVHTVTATAAAPLESLDGVTNVFVVDTTAGTKAEADAITGFVRGTDKIFLGDGAAKTVHVIINDNNEIVIYDTQTNAFAATDAGILAVVTLSEDIPLVEQTTANLQELFTGKAGTVTVDSIVKRHDGAAAATAEQLTGTAAFTDIFAIDDTAGTMDSADVINNFDPKDKIKIGAGASFTHHLHINGNQLIIYANETLTNGQNDDDTNLGRSNSGSGDGGVLAVVNFGPGASIPKTKAALEALFIKTAGRSNIIGFVSEVHDGPSSAAQPMEGSTEVALADIFVVDAAPSARAQAVTITKFNRAADKIRIGDGTEDATLFVRTEPGDKLVIYNNETNALAGADAGILAVVTLTAAIADGDLTIENIQKLFYGTGTFTVSSIIKLHSGTAEGATALTGVAALTDVFAIDADSGNEASADTIGTFDATKDKIQIGDGTGIHNVHVRIVNNVARLYDTETNALAGANAGILAVVTPTATIADKDLTIENIQALFVSNGRGSVTVGSINKFIEVTDGANSAAARADGVTTVFGIDATATNRATADTITGFVLEDDKIRIGDGTSEKTVHLIIKDDNEIVIYANKDNAFAATDAGILAVVTLSEDIPLAHQTEANLQGLFTGTGAVTVASIVKTHDGAAAATAEQLSGSAAFTDIFSIDTTHGTTASADKIGNFDRSKDKVMIGDGAANHTVHVRITGTELVIYAATTTAAATLRGADANILAVLTLSAPIPAADLTKTEMEKLFVGTGTVTVGSVVKVHDGVAAAANNLAGSNAAAAADDDAIDLFIVDAAYGTRASADKITAFDITKDRILIGEGNDLLNLSIRIEDNNTLVIYDTEANARSGANTGILAVVTLSTALTAAQMTTAEMAKLFGGTDMVTVGSVVKYLDGTSASHDILRGTAKVDDIFAIDAAPGENANFDNLATFDKAKDKIQIGDGTGTHTVHLYITRNEGVIYNDKNAAVDGLPEKQLGSIVARFGNEDLTTAFMEGLFHTNGRGSVTVGSITKVSSVFSKEASPATRIAGVTNIFGIGLTASDRANADAITGFIWGSDKIWMNGASALSVHVFVESANKIVIYNNAAGALSGATNGGVLGVVTLSVAIPDANLTPTALQTLFVTSRPVTVASIAKQQGDATSVAADTLDGIADLNDIFVIDATVTNKEGADKITNFDPSKDKIKIGDGTGTHNVYFRIIGNEVTIYSVEASARTGANENILVFVKTTESLTDAHISTLFVNSGAGSVAVANAGNGRVFRFATHDGDDEANAKNDLSGNAEISDVVDYFIIDEVASAAATADTISNFDPARDKIRIGDGNTATTVYLRITGDTMRIYTTEDNARSGADAGILAVVKTTTALTSQHLTTGIFLGTGAVTVGSVLHDGVASAANAMSGLANVNDVFVIDTDSGNKESADTISNFDRAVDKISIGDGTGTPTVHIRVEGNNKIVIYDNRDNAFAGADAGILTEVTLSSALADNDLTTATLQSIFTGSGTPPVTVGSIVKFQNGATNAGRDEFQGLAGLNDVFAIDAGYGHANNNDQISAFDPTKDKIRIGDGTAAYHLHANINGKKMIIYVHAVLPVGGGDNDFVNGGRAIDGVTSAGVLGVVEFTTDVPAAMRTKAALANLFLGTVTFGFVGVTHNGAPFGDVHTPHTMTGTADVADKFIVDWNTSNRANADKIINFNPAMLFSNTKLPSFRDIMSLQGSAGTGVHFRLNGNEMVLYGHDANDAAASAKRAIDGDDTGGIIVVVTLENPIASNLLTGPDLQKFLAFPAPVRSIVKVHDGVADAGASAGLVGSAALTDVFAIDTIASSEARADKITVFDPTKDKIQIGDGVGDRTVHLVVSGDDLVIYADRGNARIANKDSGILATVTATTPFTSEHLIAGIFAGTGTITIGTITHNGKTNTKQEMATINGFDNVFMIDSSVSIKDNADTISGFNQQRDKIQINDGAVRSVHITIHAANAMTIYDTEANANNGADAGILGVVTFAADIPAADLAVARLQSFFIGVGETPVTVGSVTRFHDGGDDGKNEFQNSANVKDVFVIDAQHGALDSADGIGNFEVGRDKIRIGDGSSPQTVHVVLDAANELRIYNDADSAKVHANANILASMTIAEPITSDNMKSLGTFEEFFDGPVTVGSVTRFLDGASNVAARSVTGVTGVTDVFSVDTTVGNVASADRIRNFELARDKIMIGDGTSSHTVFVSIRGTEVTLRIGDANSSNQILAVITTPRQLSAAEAKAIFITNGGTITLPDGNIRIQASLSERAATEDNLLNTVDSSLEGDINDDLSMSGAAFDVM